VDSKPDESASDEQEPINRTRLHAWVADARALCDWLEAHPEIADLGMVVSDPAEFTIGVYYVDLPADRMARAAALLGRCDKEVTEYNHVHNALHLVRRFGGASVRVSADRESVCERVEVGTETVEVPDPSATVPTITVTRPVVEWRCAPVLAGGAEMQHEKAS
jgi:hypothetical protein